VKLFPHEAREVSDALATVRMRAEACGQQPDTDETRNALMAVRKAAIDAIYTLNEAERKSRATAEAASQAAFRAKLERLSA